jgi:hypothetical protein
MGRIGNVVFDAPGATLEEYGCSAGAIARMYAELLGMRFLTRGDWYRESGWPADGGDDVDPLVFSVDGRGPNIAFECETRDYRAPAWPDPDRPQQVHLDILVPSITAADEVVARHGASLLADNCAHLVYADCVGHPLCLYVDEAVDTPRIQRIVFDCFSPRTVARFWSELMDMPEWLVDTPERVEIARTDGETPNLAFQHSISPMPRWPDPARPQQVHLDLVFDDEAEAQERAVALGAIALPFMGGGNVYADPAGHPFCAGDG